jgi:hypothetical protein
LYLNFKLEKLKSDSSSFKINEQLRDVPRYMSTVWNLKSPQIIIPIITGLTNFKNWRNKKLEEDFHRGLIKVNKPKDKKTSRIRNEFFLVAFC